MFGGGSSYPAALKPPGGIDGIWYLANFLSGTVPATSVDASHCYIKRSKDRCPTEDGSEFESVMDFALHLCVLIFHNLITTYEQSVEFTQVTGSHTTLPHVTWIYGNHTAYLVYAVILLESFTE